MVLVALLAATAPGCLAGEAAALPRLLPARPQRPPPGQGSARHPRREFGRLGPCPPPQNPTRAVRDSLEDVGAGEEGPQLRVEARVVPRQPPELAPYARVLLEG